MELISLKEALYKDRNKGMRTIVGPPLTMLLISDGFLTVQQKIEAGIVMPTELIERPASKKRKMDTKMELTKGEPSERKEAPHILVAIAKPTLTKPRPPPNIVINLGNPLHVKLYSSKKQEIPRTLSAAMKPTLNNSVLISTEHNDTLQSDLAPLQDILQKFRNNTNLLE